MKYIVSEEELKELFKIIKPLTKLIDLQNKVIIDDFLESKKPVELVAVSSLLLKDNKDFQLTISPENYVKNCNYYKIYVEHFI